MDKSKEVQDLTKRINELSSKASEEVSARAKAEADLERTNKLCGYLQESLDKSQHKTQQAKGFDKRNEKVNKKCMNMGKEGKCKFKGDSNFIHPAKICDYFTEMGKCPYEENCKDLHSMMDRETFLNSEKMSSSRIAKDSRDCKWWILDIQEEKNVAEGYINRKSLLREKRIIF